MSICVSVKTRDGIVLGTDSMAQVWAKDETGIARPVKSFSHTQKLFQIADLPIGVMAYGLVNLGNTTTYSLIREFSQSLNGTSSVEQIAERLFAFISQRYWSYFGETTGNGTLGMLVAGYSPGEHFAQIWDLVLPLHESPQQTSPGDNFGAFWRGNNAPLFRLLKGYSPDFSEILSLSEDNIDLIKKMEYRIRYEAMPVPIAVHMAEYLLNTTIGIYEFLDDPPVCGGDVQMAVITPDKQFEWMKEVATR